MTSHSSARQLAGLVEDLVGRLELADVVQQRAELEVALRDGVEAELAADGQREHDDALAVLAAGVGVVGLEHLAHQQRAAAVGVAERERVLDPPLALVGEQRP